MKQEITYALRGITNILAIAAILYLLPQLFRWLRFLYKRISLYIRLKTHCAKNGYTLRPAHPLWCFGTKNGSVCDFLVDVNDVTYAVKLWDTLGIKEELTFTEDGMYQSRIHTRPVTKNWSVIWYSKETEKRPVPDYCLRLASGRETVPVLLINPAPFEFRCPCGKISFLPGSAGFVNGMHVYSLHAFLTCALEAKSAEASRAGA